MFRQTGLTLVELMVVVAVMAIIATVAYPLYTAQVQKSRRADAKIALETIGAAQERFFTMNGAYTDDLALLDVSTAIQADSSDKGYYDLSVAVSGAGNTQFTATATKSASGAQASDTHCTSFTLSQTGAKGATNSDCW